MAAFMHLRAPKRYENRVSVDRLRCKELLRFESESVHFLKDYFLTERNETRGGALSARMKMEIFLRYLSDPGFQTGVGYDIGVDQSTVSKTFSEVLDKIVEKANEWIKFPTTADEINTAKEEWNTRFHMPTVVGALDCTHIMIKKPSLYGDEFINRKGKASINVQATCDSFEKITSIEAQWPGSVHDGRIWRNSNVQQVLRLFDGSACLLGDKGYGIAPWI